MEDDVVWWRRVALLIRGGTWCLEHSVNKWASCWGLDGSTIVPEHLDGKCPWSHFLDLVLIQVDNRETGKKAVICTRNSSSWSRLLLLASPSCLLNSVLQWNSVYCLSSGPPLRTVFPELEDWLWSAPENCHQLRAAAVFLPWWRTWCKARKWGHVEDWTEIKEMKQLWK